MNVLSLFINQNWSSYLALHLVPRQPPSYISLLVVGSFESRQPLYGLCFNIFSRQLQILNKPRTTFGVFWQWNQNKSLVQNTAPRKLASSVTGRGDCLRVIRSIHLRSTMYHPPALTQHITWKSSTIALARYILTESIRIPGCTLSIYLLASGEFHWVLDVLTHLLSKITSIQTIEAIFPLGSSDLAIYLADLTAVIQHWSLSLG